jgi:tetratricopeptide (TPR) repeat protein
VALTQVLRGLGGVGKTQLALEYAYRYGGVYHLVWWVRAEDPATLASDYAALAEPLHLPVHADTEQTETIAAVKRWLAHQERWLLILDNAPGPLAVHDYLPSSPRGHIIITSRHLGWGGTARSLTLPVLPRNDAVRLLFHGTQQADPVAAAAVAEMLGDLPLALAQAVAYIEATGLPLAAYGARLKTHMEELLRRGEVGPAYPATVATTWALAFLALQETQPAAGDLLRLCAFVAPDAIPQALLRDDPSALPAPLGAVAAHDLSWDETLAALRRYPLIGVAGEALAVHRLVQAVTRDRLAPDARARWAGLAVARMATAFPAGKESPREPRHWPTCARLLPHAAAALRHADETHQATTVAAHLCTQMGRYLRARAQLGEAQVYHARALAIREAVLGPEHPDVAESVDNLGVISYMQGRYAEAEPCLQRALAILEVVLGPEHPEVARCVNNLGALYLAQGRYAEADPPFQRALAIYERVLGPGHPDVAMSISNLAALYYRQGQYAKAEPCLQRALAIYEQAPGPPHPNVALPLNNLAKLYSTQGRHAEAESHYQQALSILESAQAFEHSVMIKLLENYAALLRATHRTAEADQLEIRARAIPTKQTHEHAEE